MMQWRRIRAVVLMAALAGVAMTNGQARAVEGAIAFDESAPALGYWLGHAQTSRGRVFIAMEILRSAEPAADGTLQDTAQLTTLELGALNVTCESVKVDGRKVTVSLPTLAGRATFQGEVADDNQHLTGKVLMEGPAVKPENKESAFTLARSMRAAPLASAQAFTGDLTVPGMGKLNMTLVFAQVPNATGETTGQWVGSSDVPAQGITALPLIDITQTDGMLKATMPIPGYPATIEAKIDEQADALVGRFKQATMDLELNLPRNRSYVSPALRRPQQPKPPYPYEVRELAAPTSGGFSIAGTLTIPKGEGPFPCSVMISGSGQQDRDETLMGHKPFLVIADHLTRNGIAVFRYDDRGVGGSGGREQLENATSKDFADDASAVIDMLTTQPGIDAKRIGIVGHSEGGLIAPIVATMRDDVAFIVLLAGPGVVGREITELQTRLILKAGGSTETEIEEVAADQKKMLDLVVAGASTEELKAAYTELEKARAMAKGGDDAEPDSVAVEAQMATLNSAWMKYFFAHDPRPTLAKVKCPVLAVNGTLDLQVWHEQNLPEIEKAIRDAGGNVTVKRYENLNHLFQPAKTGGISEYGSIETTVDPAVLDDLTAWIVKTIGATK